MFLPSSLARTGLAAVACLAFGSSASAQVLHFAPFATIPGSASAIANARDGSGRVFIATLEGLILVHDGSLLPTPFLDLSSAGARFFGLAFHPQYSSNGRFFVFYGRPDGMLVVERYTVSSDPNRADPASAQLVLSMAWQGSEHTGGQLAFGPDDYLYIATGDDGLSANARNLHTLLGKILRIDVNHGAPYAIPPENPFVDSPIPGVRREIWDYGFRNPWKFSFDRLTGDLLIGDVGEGEVEEVDFEHAGDPGGHDYGWDVMEGSHCFNPPVGCNTAGLTLPAFELLHSDGYQAIIGGYRYRGSAIPALQGTYVFGDYDGRVFGARPSGAGSWQTFKLGRIGGFYGLTTLGEGESGEIYAGTGLEVQRLVSGGTAELSIADASIQEAEATLAFSVTASAVNLTSPMTVEYSTGDGTATAPDDYTASAGTLTLPPLTDSTQMAVTIRQDETYEGPEEFHVTLANPSGAVLDDAQATGTIFNDDPYPRLSIFDCSAVEGDIGPKPTPCTFKATLDRPSGYSVTAPWTVQPGTAIVGDYYPGGGVVTFPPGATEESGVLPIVGDPFLEDDEYANLSITNPVGADVALGSARAWILDDDAPSLSRIELTHGATAPGELIGTDAAWFRLAQQPLGSYEVVVDGVAGDIGTDLLLERLGADNVTVVQSASTPQELSLRWENPIPAVVTGPHLRVRRIGCTTPCARASFRIRLRETTTGFDRFNNSGTQVTLLSLANPGDATVQGTLRLWSGAGQLLWAEPVTLGAKSQSTWNTSSWAPGKSGSATFSHDAPYGFLAGKAVALEPATGFVFEVPLSHRPR